MLVLGVVLSQWYVIQESVALIIFLLSEKEWLFELLYNVTVRWKWKELKFKLNSQKVCELLSRAYYFYIMQLMQSWCQFIIMFVLFTILWTEARLSYLRCHISIDSSYLDLTLWRSQKFYPFFIFALEVISSLTRSQ